MPNDYHITQLFIGGNKAQLNNPIYANYEEGKPHDIEVKGVIYAPKKMLVGVCFPDAPCANQHPHMTLLMGSKSGYNAVHSNNILQATCSDETKFKTTYE